MNVYFDLLSFRKQDIINAITPQMSAQGINAAPINRAPYQISILLENSATNVTNVINPENI